MIIQFFSKFALDKRFWVEKSNEIFVDILQLYTDGDFWMNISQFSYVTLTIKERK